MREAQARRRRQTSGDAARPLMALAVRGMPRRWCGFTLVELLVVIRSGRTAADRELVTASLVEPIPEEYSRATVVARQQPVDFDELIVLHVV
jgi:hypothetical protein